MKQIVHGENTNCNDILDHLHRQDDYTGCTDRPKTKRQNSNQEQFQ